MLPPAAARADYQLGTAYLPPAGAGIVERDRSAHPAADAYAVCYLNGYQTQPEENQWWRAQHPSLLLHDKVGRTVEDPGWPGELLLDTSTAAKRAAIAKVEYSWLDGCARADLSAIEADNLDSWTRSRGLLRPNGNIALARLLNARAHQRGLASAQKNMAEFAAQDPRLGFHFAGAEECAVYDDCAAYTRAYGPRVIEVETGRLTKSPAPLPPERAASPFATGCSERQEATATSSDAADRVATGKKPDLPGAGRTLHPFVAESGESRTPVPLRAADAVELLVAAGVTGVSDFTALQRVLDYGSPRSVIGPASKSSPN